MALAPSESHLEQWIVDNHQLVGYQWDEPNESWDGWIGFMGKVISRQVNLPSGRLDLLSFGGDDQDPNLCVIELKQGCVNSKTVAQCLRYMRDLREIYYWLNKTDLPYLSCGTLERINGCTPETTGMIIGSSIADRNLIIACEAVNIRVVTYDFDGDSYSFHDNSEGDINEYHQRAQIYKDFGVGIIGQSYREILLAARPSHAPSK